MAEGILSAGKFKLAGIGAEQIVFFDLLCVGGQVFLDVCEAQAGDRAADQSRNVRMLAMAPFILTAIRVVA